MRFWRMKVLRPTVSKLETQESCWYHSSSSSKTWKLGSWLCKSQSESVSKGRSLMFQFKDRKFLGREWILLYFVFCLIQVFNTVNEAHLYWWGQSVLLSLLIQMLISSKSTLADTTRIKSNQLSGHLMTQSSYQTLQSHLVPVSLCDLPSVFIYTFPLF
jgi:hypothetical protein